MRFGSVHAVTSRHPQTKNSQLIVMMTELTPAQMRMKTVVAWQPWKIETKFELNFISDFFIVIHFVEIFPFA